MKDNDVTVEQICAEAKNPKHTCRQCAFTVCPSINTIVSRILAAYKRELAEKDAEIDKWKMTASHYEEVIEDRNDIICSNESRIKRKDTEIEDLKEKIADSCATVLKRDMEIARLNEILAVSENNMSCKDDEIAKRDALIQELYDAINEYRREDCPSCDLKRKAECVLGKGPCAKNRKNRSLILRAAEALGLIDSAQEILNALAKARKTTDAKSS